MLHRVVVENFKAFGTRQEAELAPITLIYGPNSAGKSTLIQALLLLRQTVAHGSGGLLTQGSLIDLGGFPAILHGHNRSQTMRLGITYSNEDLFWPDSEDSFQPYDKQSPPYEAHLAESSEMIDVEFAFRMGERETAQQAETLLKIAERSPICTFAARGNVFQLSDSTMRAAWNSWITQELGKKYRYIESTPHFMPERDLFMGYGASTDAAWDLDPQFDHASIFPGEITDYADADRDQDHWYYFESRFEAVVRSTWSSITACYGGMLRRTLANTSYLGPLRRAPERYSSLASGHLYDVGQEGERTWQLLATAESAQARVDKWLERLGIPYRLRVQRVRHGAFSDLLLPILIDRRNGVEVSPKDVGFGISQILPIVVQAVVEGTSRLCVEQPELHLHPQLQAELADLFIEQIQRKWQQYLIETHSEALMLRIQRRIREGVLRPGDVSVLYVDPGADGEAMVQRLRLDRLGRFIDEWPHGFFEERLNEMMIGFDN